MIRASAKLRHVDLTWILTELGCMSGLLKLDVNFKGPESVLFKGFPNLVQITAFIIKIW